MGIALARGTHLVLAEGYSGCLSRKDHGDAEGPEAGHRALGPEHWACLQVFREVGLGLSQC